MGLVSDPLLVRAQVEKMCGHPLFAQAQSPRTASVTESPPPAAPRRRIPLVWIAVAVLAIMGAGVAAYRYRRAPRPMPSVAVLPFVNMSASPEADFYSDALSEEIIWLSAVRFAHDASCAGAGDSANALPRLAARMRSNGADNVQHVSDTAMAP